MIQLSIIVLAGLFLGLGMYALVSRWLYMRQMKKLIEEMEVKVRDRAEADWRRLQRLQEIEENQYVGGES